jgi:hypothetical protein
VTLAALPLYLKLLESPQENQTGRHTQSLGNKKFELEKCTYNEHDGQRAKRINWAEKLESCTIHCPVK